MNEILYNGVKKLFLFRESLKEKITIIQDPFVLGFYKASNEILPAVNIVLMRDVNNYVSLVAL